MTTLFGVLLCWQRVQPEAASTPGSAASGQQPASTAPASKIEEEAPESIPLEELEAKMSSVQEALERFDAVKVRGLVSLVHYYHCTINTALLILILTVGAKLVGLVCAYAGF